MKTLDRWTDRLEELVHEEAWEKEPTGELPVKRAARRLIDEMLVEIVSEKIARPIAEAMIAELQKGDRPH